MNTSTSNEARVTGVWEPEVKVRKQGVKNGIRRKVLTRGDIKLFVDIARIKRFLRQGFEVVLTGVNGNSKDGIRLFPCMDTEIKKMFVAAQAVGSFRESLADIRFRVEHHGQSISKVGCESLVKEARQRAENNARESACPRRVVTCPSCGTEFEIGGLSAN